jgi:hypothetical protein
MKYIVFSRAGRSGYTRAVLYITLLVFAVLSVFYTPEAASLSIPGKVSWKKVTSTATSVSLTWKKVEYAYGYTIYKKYGSKYKSIKSVRKLSYRDSGPLKPSTDFRYYVKAYRLKGKVKIYGERSAIKRVRTLPGIPSGVTVKDVTASAGSNVKFTAVPNGGAGPFAFQWYKGAEAVSGATDSTYSFAASAGDFGCKYYCRVTNMYGTVSSNPAVLYLDAGPLTSVTINGTTALSQGAKAVFTAVTAGGRQPLTYQWYKNDTLIPGAAAAVYTTDTLSVSNTGDSYKCKVTDSGGIAVTSSPVLLTVAAPVQRSVAASWNIGADTVNVVYSESLATDKVVAKLYDDGVLEISGSGNTALMIDNEAHFVAPWHDAAYAGQIKTVDIQSTVKTTDMRGWFADCINLVSVNKLPDSTAVLWKTFWGCTSLKDAPVIPSGAISMMSTFSGCSALTAAPVIPAGVQDMTGAFFLCTSLEKPPDIPAGVTNLTSTFGHCRKLAGDMTIYGSGITNYSGCFADAAVTGSGVRVYGSLPAANEILVQSIVITGGIGVTYEGLH